MPNLDDLLYELTTSRPSDNKTVENTCANCEPRNKKQCTYNLKCPYNNDIAKTLGSNNENKVKNK